MEYIDSLTQTFRREARKLAKRYEAGRITLEQWQAAMAELITSAHILAAVHVRDNANWQKVEAKINWQLGYLARFARKIASGLTGIGSRAATYADAAYITYQRERLDDKREEGILVMRELNAMESCEDCIALADMGWVTPEEMPEIGEGTICGDYCKCTLRFSDE